jgi:thiamine-monophosphate kinase
LAESVRADCLAALQRPQPRVALGLALRGLATAAIDVSDGLLADLGHILDASMVGATLRIPALPAAGLERDCWLAGGDDYELVFTAPAARHAEIGTLATSLSLALTRIGIIESTGHVTLSVMDADGQPIDTARRGYDHFG